ncbi:hypothetical protein E3P92_00448 [Wallemia ichthyophaga]|uniref:ACB domain-containing protein n=1 Tax=Wallemia ichthyophaga TaxID=245174 RepID=A0A4T0I7T0_WALIC|nr:hypothetical protein E3P91_01544 [Wallemia ichthyophaga]TIA82190.1 hypothetical protein E3P98_01553 [Wallemia ichthyophaga]TIA94295.1 hypothetical protein E3P97_00189 [Wallemia ichthyophaga]TIB03457.1 hypothetical protein E3P95_00616 [Wallemia ichthyophaga]TIB04166.1 hypothetical protein E3P94_00654 [Wallemia ichthyophaga]
MTTKFEKAVSIVNSLPKEGPVQTTTDQKLRFYALFKQANEGDVKTSRPGLMDFTGRAKWDAYKSVEGMSKEEAANKYVEALLEILKANQSDESIKYIQEIEKA